MDQADLRRYHRLLLKKQRELSSALGEAGSRLPAAGGLEGDLIDQANADEEAELHIHLHQTEGRLARAIEGALVLIICPHTFPAHPAAWAFMSVTAELAHYPRPCFSRTPRTLRLDYWSARHD